MRVLVTRPPTKAKKTCERLTAMGHAPVAMPLFRPVHFEETSKTLIARNRWSALAITSTEALHGINARHDAPGMVDRPLFAVGAKTAEHAHEVGFTRVITGKGDGEALAETIGAYSFRETSAPLLYLAGNPRAPGFEQTLTALNVNFETVTVYEMQTLDYSATQIETVLSQDNTPDAILFYSAASTQRFFELGTEQYLYAMPTPPRLLCISPGVARYVPKQFSDLVKIADAPNEEKLFTCLG